MVSKFCKCDVIVQYNDPFKDCEGKRGGTLYHLYTLEAVNVLSISSV